MCACDEQEGRSTLEGLAPPESPDISRLSAIGGDLENVSPIVRTDAETLLFRVSVYALDSQGPLLGLLRVRVGLSWARSSQCHGG